MTDKEDGGDRPLLSNTNNSLDTTTVPSVQIIGSSNDDLHYGQAQGHKQEPVGLAPRGEVREEEEGKDDVVVANGVGGGKSVSVSGSASVGGSVGGGVVQKGDVNAPKIQQQQVTRTQSNGEILSNGDVSI